MMKNEWIDILEKVVDKKLKCETKIFLRKNSSAEKFYR